MTQITLNTLVNETIAVTRANFQAVFTIGALASVVVFIVLIALDLNNLEIAQPEIRPGETFATLRTVDGKPVLTALLMISLVNLLPHSFAFGVISVATVRYMDGNPATLGECISETLPRLALLMLATVITWSFIGLGMLFFLLPGLFLMVIWYMIWPVMMVERTGLIGALSRSNALSQGARMQIFGVIVILFAGAAFTATVLGSVLPAQSLVGNVIGTFISGLFLALGSVSSAVAYHLLRAQNDYGRSVA